MADRKKRAGAYPTNVINSSKYLPKVFQTDTNKIWLDSTVDQMISKASLDQYDGFIGSKHGKVNTTGDNYISTPEQNQARDNVQLKPGIVTRNVDKSVNYAITFDDIANGIASNFDMYNYNAAYSSQPYVYNPPINIDKFLNFSNYYWVQNIPVYTAVSNSNFIDILSLSKGESSYELTDDNNTYYLQNNMLIKFEGLWGDATDITYKVTGVGSGIELVEYEDAAGVNKWTNKYKNNTINDGVWDSTQIVDVHPNTSSDYWNSDPLLTPTPFEMTENYVLADVANRPALFDGFLLQNYVSNKTSLTENIFARFSDEFASTGADSYKIYYLQVTEFDITYTLVVDATVDTSGVVTTTVVDAELALLIGDSYDTTEWDNSIIVKTEPDYFVIETRDRRKTAWSRANDWVSETCLETIVSIIPSATLSDYATVDNRAKRPILEFDKLISMWNGSEYNGTSIWHGIIDFVVDPVLHNIIDNGDTTLTVDTDFDIVPIDSVIVFTSTYTSTTYVKTSDTILTPQTILNADDTAFCNNALHSSLSSYTNADIVFANGTVTVTQSKYKANQPPLFRLYSTDSIPMEQLDNTFTGCQLFGYKPGTGAFDPILGIQLSYKDSALGAEIEFENFIFSTVYSYLVADSIDPGQSWDQTVAGYYYFKEENLLSTVYKPSDVARGAYEHLEYTVTDTANFTIPVGSSNFLPTDEFLIYQRNGKITLQQNSTQGVSIRKKVDTVRSGIVSQNNSVVELHNLLNGQDITIEDQGTDITSPTYDGDIVMTTDNNTNTITLTIGNFAIPDASIINGYAAPAPSAATRESGHRLNAFTTVGGVKTRIFYVFVQYSILDRYHRLSINGQPVSNADYIISDTSTSINENVLAIDDIVDFEFFNNNNSNSTLNTSLPDLINKNSTNEMLTTFTQSETLPHWEDIMNAMPGFVGQSYGRNNFDRINRFTTFGGTIFLHEDSGIMHDVQYTDGSLSITGALLEQGQDYDTFRTRFRNQVRRLYSTNAYTDISKITKEALSIVTGNRKGTELYKDSNMVFPHKASKEIVTLNTNQTTYDMKYVANGDDNIRDHVYVWLSHDWSSLYPDAPTYNKRILIKDKDYVVEGTKISLTFLPIVPTGNNDEFDNKLPILEIQYHQMDEDSYVPPSLVKLGLHYGAEPMVSNDQLVTHDGFIYDLAPNATLFDMNSEYFDIINAAQYEFECMTFAGLVKADKLYSEGTKINGKYSTVNTFQPSQHVSTWYTLSKLDNYVYTYYNKWATRNEQPVILNEDIYDEDVPTTWNYKSFTSEILGEYDRHLLGEELPGHYCGVYTILFGTENPHLNPWHMLGHSFKPNWWDTHYGWGDPTRYNNLIIALRNGIINSPDSAVETQDTRFARYAWDWDTKSPFDENGNMVSPNEILAPNVPIGTVNEALATPFVFGDHGPTELQFRRSNTGKAALIDAVVKLVPAKAYTEFFQPGHMIDTLDKSIAVSRTTSKVILPSAYKVPGHIYGTSLSNIEITRNGVFPADMYVDALGNINNDIVPLKVYYTDSTAATSTLSAIATTRRLDNIKNEVILNSNELDSEIELKINYKQVKYVGNGISQAQYNYTLRNGFDVDIAALYSTLDTRLMQKAGGFTKSSKVKFVAESSNNGAFVIGETDYDIMMYRGAPRELVAASVINIVRKANGYMLSGIATQQQEFKFFEPITIGNNPSTNIDIDGTTVRKYKSFTNTASVAEFGTVLSRVQDVYNFIRGYYTYLESSGYTLQYNKDAQAGFFVNWALTSEINDSVTLDLGNSIKFSTDHGHIYEYNKLCYHSNDILTVSSNVIEGSDLIVTRTPSSVTVTHKNKANFGGINTAVLDYEHAFIFNDSTTMGSTIFDKATNSRQDRLLASGEITADWDGNKRAPGYLVFNDHIVQNFDSAVQETNDFYRTDVSEFNNQLTTAKNISIGNIPRDWTAELNLDPNVVAKFYQGVIKEAGTNASVERLARFIQGAADVSLSEEYMFNNSYFGDTTKKKSTEILLTQQEINNNPQVVEFAQESSIVNSIAITEDDVRLVNSGSKSFAANLFNDTPRVPINRASETLSTETRYYSNNMQSMPDVYDSTADYAIIDQWNNYTSYQFGDLVRRNATLYKCIVDYTGLTNVSTGINELGTRTNPTFAYDTEFNIAGETIVFQSVGRTWSDIIAEGSVNNPTVVDKDIITIDGTSIVLAGTTATDAVVGNAVLIGNIRNPVFPTVSGKAITINNVLINFDNTPADVIENNQSIADITPADVVENFTGVASQQTYTITQALSPTTYSISTVTVDGTPYVETTDWTISGQDITFATPTFAGSEAIVVTLEHETVLEDTYTVNQALSASTYFVKDVTVGTVLQTVGSYTIAGQDVTFNDTSSFAAGDVVRFDLEHIDNGMNTDDILLTINNAGITGLVAELTSQETIQLSLTSTDTLATLHIHAGSTNADIGFSVIGETASVVVGLAYIPLTVAEVVSQLNNSAKLIDIVASESNTGSLVITKLSADTALSITNGNAIFGFFLPVDNEYVTHLVEVNTHTSLVGAVDIINEYFANLATPITDIFAVATSSRLNIISTRSVLDFGSTSFNTQAGIASGVQVNLEEDIANVFDLTNWTVADTEDPALFNVLIVNDTDYEVASVATVTTKFNGWNLMQVQNAGLYTSSTDVDGNAACGICAGTATSDGNDAQVTTNVPHNLTVGDFVLLTNTTTTPTIDGIHKVTNVHSADANIFYIDRFIEECGDASSVFVLRTQRFTNITQRDIADLDTNVFFNIPVNSLSFTKVTNDIYPSTRMTAVYTKQSLAETDFTLTRQTKHRVSNNDVDNMTIYNNDTNTIVAQLELFDPTRGIIPGVAQREIDITSNVDLAAYNATTDESYDVVTHTYWSDDQLNKRWWDTSALHYYDYDQSDYSYQSTHWGKLFPGSSIDVYEWTKSTVTPDMYENAVASQSVMFNTLATGEAYSTYDAVLQENIYFYSEATEWNADLGIDQAVYYFWVKDKTVAPVGRMLNTKSIADIIYNPTANGIAWFAALTPVSPVPNVGIADADTVGNAFIISNSSIYLNDSSTVLQINATPKGINHNSWMTIAKGADLIPEYYYIGLRNNLATIDAYDENMFNYNEHEFNRYGDDRTIGQTWFINNNLARENARAVINDLLKDINLYKDYKSTWDLKFVDEDGKVVLSNKAWQFTDFVSNDRTTSQPTLELDNKAELLLVDTALHNTVVIEIITVGDMYDRSEIYEYINNEWLLTEKKNSTIELLPIVANTRGSWDTSGWDSVAWDDTSIASWWRVIVDSCREHWFIGANTHKFNEFFFDVVDYVLGEQSQPNWTHKSTYVKLDVTHNIVTDAKRYTRSTLNSIIGYVDAVKPFHTKVRSITDINQVTENVNVGLEEDVSHSITLDLGRDAFENVFVGTTYDGGDGWAEYDDNIDSGENWVGLGDTYDNGEFHQPHNYASVSDVNRTHLLDVAIDTAVNIIVQTNTAGSTADADSRTFVLINRPGNNPFMFGLENSKTTTLAVDSVWNATSILLTDASAFSNTGTCWIDGEIVRFNKSGNTLYLVARGLYGTFNTHHAAGCNVVDITNAALTSSETGTIMLNDIGSSILTSTSSTSAIELQNLTQGMTL